MSLAVNTPPMNQSDRSIFDVLGGVIAEIPDVLVRGAESARDVFIAREVRKEVEATRQQLFVLALVLGSLFLLTRMRTG